MNQSFFDGIEKEIPFDSASALPSSHGGEPSADRRPARPNGQNPRPNGDRPPHPRKNGDFARGKQRGPKRGSPYRPLAKPLPKNVAVARSVASESGVLIVCYVAESMKRTILSTPRIESRGFFLPHEIRDGHKLLVSESRRSYEETLKDVPDIETRDLEKIVKKDLEKALLERFGRTPLIVPVIMIA